MVKFSIYPRMSIEGFKEEILTLLRKLEARKGKKTKKIWKILKTERELWN